MSVCSSKCPYIFRQIQVGGGSKYRINGKNAEAGKVQQLFRSVQLNVNNPTFLIMQGRVTKVGQRAQQIVSLIYLIAFCLECAFINTLLALGFEYETARDFGNGGRGGGHQNVRKQ